ncbi:MAG: hypothetical protein KJO40_04910 [Deltaproteobacteria bacterium]|nr:hypothetical protein [Deltaproteobacteria bacterium]NNK06844.1 hypothetical protein [Myxococcales bacterium]MBT8464291.1 hypothetical protein [Deltaproteobacteria bacterium]MBT8483068.1 hypothetical protein [Deltaproteobacteria bacterium]NNK42802.1 hypothetical protein [Myxococcales bacterium]
METRLQQLFQMLRWCGAAMIVAAAGTFLVQSWDQVGDVPRYLTLLGMTGLLPALAYVCGIRMQEGRSARVLMLTLLALIPIHAGVLGGFVLSQFGADTRSLGPVAQWVAPSPLAALLLVAGAGLALIPLIWAAFRVLARPHARLLTAASVASHALLLVPDRSSLAATLTVVPILGLTVYSAARVKPQTLESKLAVAFLVAPAVVIASRQLLFYYVTSAFWGAILGTGALGLFALGKKSGEAAIERLAIVPTLLSVAALVDATGPWWPTLSASSIWLAYGLISSIPLLAFAWTSTRSKAFFVRGAVILNATTAVTTLLIDPRPWAALQAIAVGIGIASYGFVKGRRPSLYSGIALAGFGFVLEVVHAIEVFQPSGWLALAAFGSALVGVTAWLERRARSVRQAAPAAKLSEPASACLPQ